MKNSILRIAMTLLATLGWLTSIFTQVVFVKQYAAGANNGSSWMDAYTDLSAALENAPENATIWVASGSYYPGSGVPVNTSVFSIQRTVSLFGGFAGTESTLEERDPEKFLTVLSGDINEDDITADFDTNKLDNTLHVLAIDSLLGPIVIDGFVIKGGHTKPDLSEPTYNRSGGGIYALSPVAINNCTFTGNFARAGGGVYIHTTASGSTFTHSRFTYNQTNARGAGVNCFQATDILVDSCIFEYNNTLRGALFFSGGSDCTIRASKFNGNTNPSNTNCAGIFCFEVNNLFITDSDFNQNTAYAATAIYIENSNVAVEPAVNTTITNCSFYKNESTDAGAMLAYINNNIVISRCLFEENKAASGGGIFIKQRINAIADSNDVRIDSCRFVRNEINGFTGSGIRIDSANAIITNCHFEENIGPIAAGTSHHAPDKTVIYRDVSFVGGISGGSGGAIGLIGSGIHSYFSRCHFNYNSSSAAGGAIFNNGYAEFNDCSFIGNRSETRGGAIAMFSDSSITKLNHCRIVENGAFSGGAIVGFSGSNQLFITQSEVTGNYSSDAGGAIWLYEVNPDVNISTLEIDASTIAFNRSSNKGGAIFATDANISITNSLLYENSCNGDGQGGVAFIQKTNGGDLTVNLLNITMADNYGDTIDGIYIQSQDSLPGEIIMQTQNSIFCNPYAGNFLAAGPDPQLISKGGNMSGDMSMNSWLTHATDVVDVCPEFAYRDTFNYHLAPFSIAIDAGVGDNAPLLDILGNPRDSLPDIGAYEFQHIVNTTSQTSLPIQCSLFPNPSKAGSVNIEMAHPSVGMVRIEVVDMQGRSLASLSIPKTTEVLHYPFPTASFVPGIYLLFFQLDNQLEVKQMALF